MRPHILVVDDHDASRLLACRMLEGEGYRVTAYPTGGEALAWLEHEAPDLVVSDIMMPGIDGYELLARLRADPRLKAVPVIFLTALTDEVDIEHGRRLGVDQYLTKPFTTRGLLGAVSGTLKRYAELREARVVAAPAAAVLPAGDLVPSGIGPVDDQVGGLARGHVYLVLGDIVSGKRILATQFLHTGLARGEGALLLTTERFETVLYAGASVGLDLRPAVRSGRLALLGLVDRFEQMVETREDVVALTAEIVAAARDVGASRVVVSSALTVLCSSPRLVLSTAVLADLIGGLEHTGAVTLLVSETPVTAQEEQAQAYLERTVLGTLRLDKEPGTPGLGVLSVEGMHGVARPSGRPVRVAAGVGLVTFDPGAESAGGDALTELRQRVERAAPAAEHHSGLVLLASGGRRLRDPFRLYVRQCLHAAQRASPDSALVLATWDGREPAPDARLLAEWLQPTEVVCWRRPGELVVLAVGASAERSADLERRLRARLEGPADLRLVTVCLPASAPTIDGLLDALGRALAEPAGASAEPEDDREHA